jgi:uncharacterized protein
MSNNKIERRSLVSELRAESQGDEMAIAGYAALFNSLSKDLGGFKERIAPGAFTRSLASGADVKALVNHDPSQLLGRTKNSTLKLEQDDRGLKFRVSLNPDVEAHRSIHALISNGTMDECSFGFMIPDGGDAWDEAKDEEGRTYQRRTLRDLTLFEISSVVFPAYNETSVAARAMADYYADDTAAWVASKRDFLANFEGDAMRRNKAAEIFRQISRG